MNFLLRAAGHIVSVMNPNTVVFHYHNPFDSHYQKFRADCTRRSNLYNEKIFTLLI